MRLIVFDSISRSAAQLCSHSDMMERGRKGGDGRVLQPLASNSSYHRFFARGGEIGACNVLAIRDKPMTVRIFPASSIFLFIKEADERLLFVADLCSNLAELEGLCKLAGYPDPSSPLLLLLLLLSLL